MPFEKAIEFRLRFSALPSCRLMLLPIKRKRQIKVQLIRNRI